MAWVEAVYSGISGMVVRGVPAAAGSTLALIPVQLLKVRQLQINITAIYCRHVASLKIRQGGIKIEQSVTKLTIDTCLANIRCGLKQNVYQLTTTAIKTQLAAVFNHQRHRCRELSRRLFFEQIAGLKK